MTRARLLATAAGAVCATPFLYAGVADALPHGTGDPQPIVPTYYQLQTPSRTYGDLSKGPLLEVVDVPGFGTCLLYQQEATCK